MTVHISWGQHSYLSPLSLDKNIMTWELWFMNFPNSSCIKEKLFGQMSVHPYQNYAEGNQFDTISLISKIKYQLYCLIVETLINTNEFFFKCFSSVISWQCGLISIMPFHSRSRIWNLTRCWSKIQLYRSKFHKGETLYT